MHTTTQSSNIEPAGTCHDPGRCQNWIDSTNDLHVHVERRTFLAGLAGTWQVYDGADHSRLDCGILTPGRADELLSSPRSDRTLQWVADVVVRVINNLAGPQLASTNS